MTAGRPRRELFLSFFKLPLQFHTTTVHPSDPSAVAVIGCIVGVIRSENTDEAARFRRCWRTTVEVVLRVCPVRRLSALLHEPTIEGLSRPCVVPVES
jgi:hypothetical protein